MSISRQPDASATPAGRLLEGKRAIVTGGSHGTGRAGLLVDGGMFVNLQ